MWSHDFAHINRIYRLWAPEFQPSPAMLEDVKSTLKAPGGIEGALGYYWSVFKDSPLPDPNTTISVPTLVIAGSEDSVFGSDNFTAARPAFTARYVYLQLKNVGHFPELEAADQVASGILSFLLAN